MPHTHIFIEFMQKFTSDPHILALYARLGDLIALSERGEVAFTPFLSPREAMYAQSYLSSYIEDGLACLWGGYTAAERVRAIILPAYIEGMISLASPVDASPCQKLLDAGFDELALEVSGLVATLSLAGSGFRDLTHRDYLGSVLGLGLERDVIGDILVLDTSHAYLFCKGEMVPFLQENLTHVANDPVRISILDPHTPISYQKTTKAIRDTVASPRLDCVVAALCNLSRERAQSTIRQGLVELNYEACESCDENLTPPCVLSVRGTGKFRVLSFDGETRKGRLRMVAEKYV